VQAIVCRFVDTKTSVPSAQIASGRHALQARAGGGIEEADRLSAMWYFYAAIGPAIWALLNHLDKYLLGRFFRHGATGAALAVFTGFAGVLVACGILLFDLSRAAALEPRQALLVMAAGAFLVASYIPYLVALESAEASVVASLFRLLPFFVFTIAYIVLGETLRTTQIVGGLLTTAGAALLTLDLREDTRRLRVRSLLLMCAACVLNACGAVIFKFVALGTSFWASAFWEYVGAGGFAMAMVHAWPPYRRTLATLVQSREALILMPVALAGEILNLLAGLSVAFAGLMAPLALVSIVTGLHPFFALVYGVILTRYFPAFGTESLKRRHVAHKALAMAIMWTGIAVTFS
jgi:drug/metabolite transporter (DMT)-like permease